MFCAKCGAKIKYGSRFCIKCGAKLETPAAYPAGVSKPVRHTGGVKKTVLITGMVLICLSAISAMGISVFMSKKDAVDDAISSDTAATSAVIGTEAVIAAEVATVAETVDESIEEAESIPKLPTETQPDIVQEPQAVELVEEESRYILPDSDSVYLSRSDLEGLTQEECRLARNELYARHGRKFDDEGLQDYFNAKDWYTGTIDPADFSDSVLNDFEMANRDLLVLYEEEMGYR